MNDTPATPPEPSAVQEALDTPDFAAAERFAQWVIAAPSADGLPERLNLARAYLALRAVRAEREPTVTEGPDAQPARLGGDSYGA